MSLKGADPEDVDRAKASPSPNVELPSDDGAVYSDRWTKKLFKAGVEDRGAQPVPEELRTDTQYYKIFFIWFAWNLNILTFSAGTLGPVIFGLGLRDTCLTILFFNIVCCAFPAYICAWGPKLGMRQMVITRYSFGYYGTLLPCILNLVAMMGFTILNCIVGGQALASVNTDLSWTVGIVVIAVISLLVSFCGYNLLNWYERVCWIPVVIIYIIALGLPASAILNFASTLAGFVITFSGMSSDFSVYFKPTVSSWRIFLYVYAGLLIPVVTIQSLGAAVVVAVPGVPEWTEGYAGGNIGGLLEAMLHPVGGFGKFLTVLLSLSAAGNIAGTLYSVSINFQVFVPWLVAVPRYLLSILATGIVVALAIPGAHRFYDTLVNFLGIIGYWATPVSWDVPHMLPSGIAALAAGLASIAIIVPCMHQHTGDIGFEVGGVLTAAVLYFPFRMLEKRIQGR
ncbi:purine-cytosine permease [Coprinopsis sp. MPI-PUGE-AT-0042]|nr:purine-cytosine permease [Coprinopsis sp. MPI-PUGE-AT-0042]